jgi:pimeloyl-ACP methyl ester carboxylesterase
VAKEPLILVPGVLCDEDLYRDQVPALSAHADVSITMEHTRHDTLSDIARAILDAAPARFALCGLSMGGIIAFEIMRQQPGRVSRLALLDTNAREILADERKVREGRMRLVANGHVDVMVGLQLSRFIPLTRLGDDALVDGVLKMVRRVGAATYLRQERALLRRVDSRPSLDAIACPALVLGGREGRGHAARHVAGDRRDHPRRPARDRRGLWPSVDHGAAGRRQRGAATLARRVTVDVEALMSTKTPTTPPFRPIPRPISASEPALGGGTARSATEREPLR